MKKIFQLFFLCLMVKFSFTQNLTFQWAGAIGGSGNDYGNSIVEDALGNTYFTGRFYGTCDFDPGPAIYTLTTISVATDAYVLKLDPAGNFLWVKQLGGISDEEGLSIKLDASGNVYSVGYFALTVDFDPGPGVFNLSSPTTYAAYISKLDPSGNFIWAKQLTGTDDASGKGLVLDGAGNVCVIGDFKGTVDFDPGPSTYTISSNAKDIFIAKLDGNGNFIWANSISGPTNNDRGFDISIDGGNNIYATGDFCGTVDFDPAITSFTMAAPVLDVFISKFGMNGNFIWAKQIGGSPAAGVAYGDMVVDPLGNVFSTGSFNSVIDVDPGASVLSYTPVGVDFYLSKLDASGNMLWTKQITGTSNEGASGLCLDIAGDLYTTGGFNNGVIDMDPGPGTTTFTAPNSNSVIFIGKYNSSGSLVWAQQLSGSGSGRGACICVNSGNSIITLGQFSGIIDFDPGPATSNLAAFGGEDVFVQKMNQCLPPTAPVNTTPTTAIFCQGNFSTLTATSSGAISWYSNPTGGSALGSGTAFVTPTLSIGSYTYFAEAFTCTNSVSRTPVTFSVSLCTDIINQHYYGGEINIYPNPSNGVFTISLPEYSNITILNVLGKVIMVKSLSEGKQIIDLSEFDEHLFILKVESEGKTKVVKILKE